MSHPSGLLSLNDDVLLLIFSFLDSQTALVTASTSKRAYRIAISCVFADLSWGRAFNADKEDGSESLALSRYMCAPEPLSQVPRIQHLRHLGLGHGIHEVDLPPLRTLFCQAFNLRTIQIVNFEFFIDDDGLVIQAIGAMQHLEQARFMRSGPGTVSALPNLLSSQKLTCLTLDFDGTYYEEDIFDFPALFAGLSSATSIRTLSITFSFFLTAPSTRASHDVTLSSIRHLTLSTLPGPVPAHIITLCPNIDTLSLVLFSWSEFSAVFSMSAEDRWPARLKELDFPKHIAIAEDTARCMKPVHCLSLGNETPIPGGADFKTVLPLLETFRPTVLELRTTGVLTDAGRMWDTLRDATPQLRSLSIVVAGAEYDVREYVDPLIAALRSTSLVHLSLEFPPTSWGFDVASLAHADRIRTAEIHRVETLRPLPLRLAEAFPSLRVLALSSCKPDTTDLDPEVFHTLAPAHLIAEREREEEILRRWGPDSEFLNASMRKTRELDVEIARDKRWWWVEGEGAGRTPVEIWREDGERARDLIKRTDFDPEKGLDGFYSEKCRYER